MTPHEVTAQWWDHATLWNADDPSLLDAGHTTDGGRVFGITRTRYTECDHYGCEPVAVIAYKDRGAVERLGQALYNASSRVQDEVDCIADALREFANPKPPKPEEPTGLGAVVEDTEGEQWVRFRAATGWWWRDVLGKNCRYADLPAVRVLSEGVPS